MKLLIKEIIQEKDKPWNVVKTMFVTNRKCKTCGKQEARNGSSYCQECSNLYKQNVVPK